MWEYSDIVKEHYKNPKNVGSIENADAIGEAGSLTCGDALKIYLKINDKGVITNAKFQTFGCGSAVASSSILTEMVIGKTVEEAKKITNKQIAEKLGGLPPEKMHCSVMVSEALEDALKNYTGESKIPVDDDKKIICKCFDVTQGEIKKAIKQGAVTLDALQSATSAGLGCGRCKDNLKRILDENIPKPQAEAADVGFILKVNKVIEQTIASELAKDCGGLELVDIKGKDVYVKLTGSCKGCCNSQLTLKSFVEAQLREHVDQDIRGYEGTV
jgi:NifU-like protein